ncbi:7TM chemoreceptor [Cinara cedri]|uniref:7TM chemoreceptor n=1 Tax=Cinara cedri TaxID=506608 RepID=A0A5E4MS24_9HEMI|nr:7TM chemoreceptor [Cinara cedri]
MAQWLLQMWTLFRMIFYLTKTVNQRSSIECSKDYYCTGFGLFFSHVVINPIIVGLVFARVPQSIDLINMTANLLFRARYQRSWLISSTYAMVLFLCTLFLRLYLTNISTPQLYPDLYYPFFISNFAPMLIIVLKGVLCIITQNAYEDINRELEELCHVQSNYERAIRLNELMNDHWFLENHTETMVDMFGAEMIFITLDLYIQFLLYLYILTWEMVIRSVLMNIPFLHISPLIELFFIIGKLCYLCYRCHTFISEREDVIYHLKHLGSMVSNDVNSQTILRLFTLRVNCRKMKVSASDYFDINLSLLFATAGGVLGYFLILAQFQMKGYVKMLEAHALSNVSRSVSHNDVKLKEDTITMPSSYHLNSLTKIAPVYYMGKLLGILPISYTTRKQNVYKNSIQFIGRKRKNVRVGRFYASKTGLALWMTQWLLQMLAFIQISLYLAKTINQRVKIDCSSDHFCTTIGLIMSHVIINTIVVVMVLARLTQSVDLLNMAASLLFRSRFPRPWLTSDTCFIVLFPSLLFFRLILTNITTPQFYPDLYYPYFFSNFAPLTIVILYSVLCVVTQNSYEDINRELEELCYLQSNYKRAIQLNELMNDHWFLEDYTETLADSFGTEIVLITLDIYIQFLLYLYTLTWEMVIRSLFTKMPLFYINTIVELFVIIGKLYYLCYRCDASTNEGKRIIFHLKHLSSMIPNDMNSLDIVSNF